MLGLRRDAVAVGAAETGPILSHGCAALEQTGARGQERPEPHGLILSTRNQSAGNEQGDEFQFRFASFFVTFVSFCLFRSLRAGRGVIPRFAIAATKESIGLCIANDLSFGCVPGEWAVELHGQVSEDARAGGNMALLDVSDGTAA